MEIIFVFIAIICALIIFAGAFFEISIGAIFLSIVFLAISLLCIYFCARGFTFSVQTKSENTARANIHTQNSKHDYPMAKFDESILDFSQVGVLLLSEDNLKIYAIQNGFQEAMYCRLWFKSDLKENEYKHTTKRINNHNFDYITIGNYVVIQAISNDIMGIGYFRKNDNQAEAYLANRIIRCLDMFQDKC